MVGKTRCGALWFYRGTWTYAFTSWFVQHVLGLGILMGGGGSKPFPNSNGPLSVNSSSTRFRCLNTALLHSIERCAAAFPDNLIAVSRVATRSPGCKPSFPAGVLRAMGPKSESGHDYSCFLSQPQKKTDFSWQAVERTE